MPTFPTYQHAEITMKTAEQVRAERRKLAASSHERWKAYQTDAAALRGAKPNRDGWVSQPRIAPSTPIQLERFEAREQLRATFDSAAYRELRRATERQVGATLDFVDLPPDEQALKAGRPVVRLVTLSGAGIIPEGFATAFLVAPSLILTNHHVFRDRDEARGTGAQFLYERTKAGLREGLIFELDPDGFFVNNKALDYALVAVRQQGIDGAPLSQFQFLPLIAAKGKIRKGDPVNIIQHAEGRPKQYATVNNHLLDLRDDGFLLYETDTLEGSSGSPVYNQHWEVIGLHHCGVPQMEGGMLVTRDNRRVAPDAEVADSDLIWIANEGVRVSAIVASLAEQRLDSPKEQQILDELLAETADPLTLVTEHGPLVAGVAAGTPALLPTPSAAMATTTFQFTGPVTIFLNGAAREAAAVPSPRLPPPLPPPPAPQPEAEFREKTLKFDENYKSRSKLGYKADFLDGWEVPTPTLTKAHNGEPLTDNDGKPWVLHYYHYSLVMNRDRRLVAWAASNVDYSKKARAKTKKRKEYGGENWRLDPRVALEAPGLQIEDVDFYAPAKKIDRGHIVRREDGAWGATAQEAEFGNSDTYHWTNCTPQSEAFNQAGEHGIWGEFEEHIQREVAALGGRMVVFAGPVLNPDDPEHGYRNTIPIQVPMEFWKVVLCTAKEQGKTVRLAYGFVFDQTEPVERLGYEAMNMEDYEVYQMPISEVAKKTGIEFDHSVLQADVLKGGRGNERIRGFEGRRLRSVRDVVLRGDYGRTEEPDLTGIEELRVQGSKAPDLRGERR
jgi:endonuclease G, mitochondrial